MYQKLIKSFNKYISNPIIPNILNKEDIDIVIDEKVSNENFEKSDTEIETYESIEELKFPQEYDDGGIIILEEVNDPRVQALFKRSIHNSLSIIMSSQFYYELPKRTIRTNGSIYHLFKPNNFRDVQNLYQDKAPMDMTLNELKFLTSTCWNKNYQPLLLI